MGIHLKKLGQQVVRIAQGVADHLGNSVVSPPAPVLLGVAAVCFGAAAVKHVRRTNCKSRKQQLTPKPEESICTPRVSSQGPSSSTVLALSPKTPTPITPALCRLRVEPFSLRGPVTRIRQSTVVSNGQLIAAADSSVSQNSSTSLIPASEPAIDYNFPTPEKAAEVNDLDCDSVLHERDELANLHQHHQAISALANVTNRDQGSNRPSSHLKVQVPPLSLDQLASSAMHTCQASTQLSMPHNCN